jgi:hypothetical protein
MVKTSASSGAPRELSSVPAAGRAFNVAVRERSFTYGTIILRDSPRVFQFIEVSETTCRSVNRSAAR